MAVKMVGFFREGINGAPGDPSGPSIHDWLGKLSPDERRRVAEYLDQGKVIVTSCGPLGDILNPARGKVTLAELRTDGVFMWPTPLAYYVREYGVGLPSEFLSHMEAAGWSPPRLSDEAWALLAKDDSPGS
ncbi:hypothetical protein JY651_07965 [Pyxidicoccus parkwayensis]|uniref:Uncharacterized protein n=1 Tax=Pyxidicoccus parkwayensis TaxID=2813578 RepID=A0ABX7P317_9BACT|nr:hypothetical protein [Pyxidicoccus parkwaysis]QSQ24865.1 hypothetical protein JY651_07965 [Pyxidicoccus parkwaysis]